MDQIRKKYFYETRAGTIKQQNWYGQGYHLVKRFLKMHKDKKVVLGVIWRKKQEKLNMG